MGKGNRKHRNVSTISYRNGFDNINWGSGKKPKSLNKTRDCITCRGEGIVNTATRWCLCATCNGSGKLTEAQWIKLFKNA
jgi:DnaJ-class molecular chaperone